MILPLSVGCCAICSLERQHGGTDWDDKLLFRGIVFSPWTPYLCGNGASEPRLAASGD